MTWHADTTMLRAYERGDLGPAHAASVEAHLTACDSCRADIASIADRSRLDRSWSVIVERLDEPHVGLAERALVRLGIGEHRARLVVMTPSLRSPAAAAMVLALAFVSMTSLGGGVNSSAQLYVFLVLAPLLPLVGVAAAFGTGGDPARELTAATPTSAFELLVVRTFAIVAATTVLTTIAAIPLPSGWQAAAWLLPALGLTAATLALSTWLPAHVSGIALGVLWIAGASVSWRVNRFDADVLSRFAALRPTGQLLFAAITVACALIVVVRRDTIDHRGFA